jgi:rhodanese-related sulfurtransferase
MKDRKHRSSSRKSFPVWGWIILAVVLLAIAGLVVLKQPKPTTSLPIEISVSQAAQEKDKGALILDVREPSEWVQFHIQGATHIPLGELPNRLNEIPKDREIIVVCRSGARSAQGRDILLNAGYTQVTSMADGLTAWQSQGLPTVSGQ